MWGSIDHVYFYSWKKATGGVDVFMHATVLYFLVSEIKKNEYIVGGSRGGKVVCLIDLSIRVLVAAPS